MLSIAWQIAYTVAGISLLTGLAAVILVGACTCVLYAMNAMKAVSDALESMDNGRGE